jgi:small-conductance mechanosensitive channel
MVRETIPMLLPLLFAVEQDPAPLWPDRLLPLAIVLALIPLVPLLTHLVRRFWLAGVAQMPWRLSRAVKRVETLLSFVRSIAYFTLFILAVFFAIHSVWPDFNPLAATGALSIVALILTGMFKDVVVDVVKGLDILLGSHYDVGDYIEVAGTSGHVIDFQLKYTRLRTPSGEEVVLNNAQCIPSRRFRQGRVTNYVSVPLQRAVDEQPARDIVDRAAVELDHLVEAVQDRPSFDSSIPLPVSGGVVLRYTVDVLPGARWVMDEVFLPLVKRSLDAGGIELGGDLTYFYMNDVAHFRQLFNRDLSPDEIEQWMAQKEEAGVTK